MQPVFIIIFVIVAAVGGYFAWRHDQARRRLLYRWARAKGLTRDGDHRRGWEKIYPAVKLFGRGHSRKSILALEGEQDGRSLVCIDYRYVTGSGKNRQTHRYGVVLLPTPGPVIPLRIRREHLFDKVGEFFGHDDIDFESAEFSRKFHVSSADRRWAYDVIHQGTMDYLLQAPSLEVEFGFGEIAVYRKGALSAATCDEGLRMARKLLDLVPADVLAQVANPEIARPTLARPE
ncbi:MAG: hypothetical protein GY838_01530 [bacterium]|nr:hypothetical protein [bacterium]